MTAIQERLEKIQSQIIDNNKLVQAELKEAEKAEIIRTKASASASAKKA